MAQITETSAGSNVAAAVRYHITAAEIEAKRAEYAGLSFDTPSDYAIGVKAIASCRTTRVAIEDRRKELKAESLAYGRRVDAVAHELTGLIESIEEPLRAKKRLIDEAKERAKREAEEAKRREIEEQLRREREAQEAKERAEREAEEARRRAEREAEEARLRAEREAEDRRLAVEREQLRAERERIAAEQAQLRAAEAERARAAAAETDRLAAERRALEEERASLERAEAERRNREAAEQRAREAAERERIAAEEARVAELERRAALEARIAALMPDVEKLAAYGRALLDVAAPEVGAPEAVAALAEARRDLARIAERLAGVRMPSAVGGVSASRPVVVCLCGSTRFTEAWRAANLSETLAGRIVLTVGCDTKSDADLALDDATKARLDELHKRKIDIADEVLILNVGGYIGDSTRSELAYAEAAGKRVRWLEEP